MSDIRLIGEHPGEGSRPKKKLQRRSEVWEHFEESPDGEKAKCKYCLKVLSGKSTGGTTHLKRHIDICDKRPRGDVNQPLTLHSRDEVRNIGLTQKVTCLEDVVKKAILDEVPLASKEFQKGWYSLCPMEPIDVGKKICAYYEREKENLAIELNNLTSRICFSVDITMVKINEGFLSLTAHFINADFNLVRKLISIKELSDYSLSSIINVLESCISELNLEEKIFSFTIDLHGVMNLLKDELIKGLREKFSPKMLFGGHYIRVPSCEEQLEESFLSFRDSPFYSGEGDSTKRFLEVLTRVPSKIDTFNQIAKDMGLSPIKESWFHTYSIMSLIFKGKVFKDILIYREVFHQYYARTETLQLFFPGICSYSFHWQILELIVDISGLVESAINEFKSFKHPTSHLYLLKIFEIVDMIVDMIVVKKKNSNCTCEGGECRVHDWKYLQDQFVRYFIEVEAEDIFIVAGVLDPRFKLSFFEYCMKEIGNFIGLEKTISDYREIINNFFSEYAKKEADHVCPSLEVVGIRNTQDEGNLLNNNTYRHPTKITERFSQHIRGFCVISELDEYLGEKVIEMGGEDFDLLGWWKQNQSRFPVLSRMARDILAVPATVRDVLDSIKTDYEDLEVVQVERRLLEAVICSKDWIIDRQQRATELKISWVLQKIIKGGGTEEGIESSCIDCYESTYARDLVKSEREDPGTPPEPIGVYGFYWFIPSGDQDGSKKYYGSFDQWLEHTKFKFKKVSSKGRVYKSNKNYGSPYEDPFLRRGDDKKRKRKTDVEHFWEEFNFNAPQELSKDLKERTDEVIGDIESGKAPEFVYMNGSFLVRGHELLSFLKKESFPVSLELFGGDVDNIRLKSSHLLSPEANDSDFLVVFSGYDNKSWWMIFVDMRENVAEIYYSGVDKETIRGQVENEVLCIRHFLLWRFLVNKFLSLRIRWIDSLYQQDCGVSNSLMILRVLVCKLVNKPLPDGPVDVGVDEQLLGYHLIKDAANTVKGII
ncbi:hypothetical protein LUZ61_012775 [Rhynchospora tenuis]|uniref:BED-type domain-containing protein n=1 Tax=Rhynchospora tenuis TaxID=198213 RepID=A0AAD6A3Q0_9POAL|nr:hypothetical protein LUZ61_012775 [Rhynchospora tenuis]